MKNYKIKTIYDDDSALAEDFYLETNPALGLDERITTALATALKSKLSAYYLSRGYNMEDLSKGPLWKIFNDELVCLIMFADIFEVKDLYLYDYEFKHKHLRLSEVMSALGLSLSPINNKDSVVTPVLIDSDAKTQSYVPPAPLSPDKEDSEIIRFILDAKKANQSKITDPLFAAYVLSRAIRELNQIVETAQTWRKFQFSASTYYWNFGDILNVDNDFAIRGIKSYLPTETIVQHIEEVRYFIENKRLEWGMSQDEAHIPTI